MKDAIFFYEQDCPICNRVLMDVILPLETRLRMEFKRVEVNANRGGEEADWYWWFSRRVRREIVPLLKIGGDVLFVPALQKLPLEERIKHAREARLEREINVLREKINGILEQREIPKTPPPLGMTHQVFRTGYLVPRRI